MMHHTFMNNGLLSLQLGNVYIMPIGPYSIMPTLIYMSVNMSICIYILIYD